MSSLPACFLPDVRVSNRDTLSARVAQVLWKIQVAVANVSGRKGFSELAINW